MLEARKIFLIVLFFTVSLYSGAVNYTSNGSGLWSVAATWTPVGVPTAADNVTIKVGNTVTMDANPGSCINLIVSGTLTWVNARTLNVSGNLLMNSGSVISGTATGVLNVTGTFTAAAGTETIDRNTLNVTSTSSISGVISYTSATGVKTFTGNVALNAGSGFTFTTAATVACGGSVSTTGAVVISGAAVGNLSIGTTLTVPAASTLSIGSANLTVTGATSISGTISFTNANGTMSFGSVTVNAGGTWNCSAVDMPFTMNGNLTNSGTFNASLSLIGAGNAYTFTSGAATISGTLSIPQIKATGAAVVTNSGVLTITDSLYGPGQYVQAAASTLYWDSPNTIVITTFTPTGAGNTVDYNYAGNQTIKGGAAVTYINVNASASGTKLLGNTLNVTGNLLIQNTAVLDADVLTNRSINLGGNWTITSTAATPFIPEAGTVTFNGSAGVQAISTVAAAGETFYSVVFNNTSPTTPNITTNHDINLTHNTTFTSGVLDLVGHNYVITGDVTNTTDHFNAGSIITSVGGSNFNVTDPNQTKIIYFWGTAIGTAANGITFNVTAGRIQFDNFTEYGTANFTKTLNTDDVFGGGNYYHGPVTFTATYSASRWRMGDNTLLAHAVADTFVNATFIAGANSGANNNFIIGANSLGNAFYGTTNITSNTIGGIYICRFNDSGSASCTFYGPVNCSIDSSGSVTFANSAVNHANVVTFNSTITLNSSTASTGFYLFANANIYGSVILTPTANFATGSIKGQTNVYLNNVTQLGPNTQIINTSGSTGGLYVGGVTGPPAWPCTFNGTCTFTADTVGYFVGCTYNGPVTINVNHPNANGYILNNIFNSTLAATVGDIRFRSNIFNGTTSLTHTAAFNSTSNGGNTFAGTTTITNSGLSTLEVGSYAADDFQGNVTFVEGNASATCVVNPNYSFSSTYEGNITANSTNPMVFGVTAGGIAVIDGNTTQTFSSIAAALPTVTRLTMNTTGTLQTNFNLNITNTLTMTNGLININGNTLTLGTATANPGTLSYTAGVMYGGTFTRWFNTAIINLGTVTGLFPMGSSAGVYHPFWFEHSTGALTTGGTVSVLHNPTASGSNWASFNDVSWGNTVAATSVSAWKVTTANSLAVNGVNSQIRFGGNGFNPFVLADLDACLIASAIGTFSAATNVNVPLEVNRYNLTTANLNNTWYIGTDNAATSPLPIKLLSFDATPSGDVVDLSWSTATETNNASFTVQRTADGQNFDDVVTVPGAGNSSQTINYAST
ncbi:MAG TPA: G8 domain-containing protein, partial [Bacteroidia bacterium]|nr:G8 domain-containing protein [Bacteroidia bacterium]